MNYRVMVQRADHKELKGSGYRHKLLHRAIYAALHRARTKHARIVVRDAQNSVVAIVDGRL